MAGFPGHMENSYVRVVRLCTAYILLGIITVLKSKFKMLLLFLHLNVLNIVLVCRAKARYKESVLKSSVPNFSNLL